jgi:hypothetical protein
MGRGRGRATLRRESVHASGGRKGRADVLPGRLGDFADGLGVSLGESGEIAVPANDGKTRLGDPAGAERGRGDPRQQPVADNRLRFPSGFPIRQTRFRAVPFRKPTGFSPMSDHFRRRLHVATVERFGSGFP